MACFTDKLERAWTIDLTLGEIERVKGETGHDLSQPGGGDPPLLSRFQVDLEVRGQVTWSLCRPQAEAREIDLAGFLAGLDGATLRRSYEAVVEGLCDFFRQLGRCDTAAWIEKMTAVTDHAAGLTAEKIQQGSTQTIAETALKAATATATRKSPRSRKASSRPATGSPDGSASTPGR